MRKSPTDVIVEPVTAPNFTEVHPLEDAYMRFGASTIADILGHSNHSTVSLYVTRARRNQGLLVPVEWVEPLCRLTRRDPHAFRPDLYEENWQYSVDTTN